jgi:hypothetical protein
MYEFQLSLILGEGRGRTAGPRVSGRPDWMRWDGEGITAASDDDQRTLNEPRDVLPDERDTLTMRVSSDGADLALELFGTSDDIFGERILCQLSESWPFHQRRYLFQSNPRIPESKKGFKKRGSQIIHPNIGVQETETEKGCCASSSSSSAKGMRIRPADSESPYLAIEGDWRLIKPGLLRVPDVR